MNPVNKVKTDNILHKNQDNSFSPANEVINQLIEDVTPQVQVDWNASSGITSILNKPVLENVATSGDYNDLSNKPSVMTGATETVDGTQGFVKKPLAGDQDKVLCGNGDWKFISGKFIGESFYYAGDTVPNGCLLCDGATVSRAAFPELFSVVGTKFGAGDGSTTFNLPNDIDRFKEGGLSVGTHKPAGLPNIQAELYSRPFGDGANPGCVWGTGNAAVTNVAAGPNGLNVGLGSQDSKLDITKIDASRSNPIYGGSTTVQPNANVYLPCIKAFDAFVNPGLVDITELANEIASKTDKHSAVNAVMLSDTFIPLTLPASQNTITIPADGYLFFERPGDAGQVIQLSVYRNGNLVIRRSKVSSMTNQSLDIVLPVQTGDSVYVYYTAVGLDLIFRFIYANGNKP